MFAHLQPAAFLSPRLSNAPARFARTWRALRTRLSLADLDDRMLADIGVTRAQALREADRLPWDLNR